MYSMGLDFRAPKQTDFKQWKKVRVLFAHEIAFHSCGCGAGHRPRAFKDAPEFLEREQPKSPGQRFLERVSHRRYSAA
jgi:hypothetical protein